MRLCWRDIIEHSLMSAACRGGENSWAKSLKNLYLGLVLCVLCSALGLLLGVLRGALGLLALLRSGIVRLASGILRVVKTHNFAQDMRCAKAVHRPGQYTQFWSSGARRLRLTGAVGTSTQKVAAHLRGVLGLIGLLRGLVGCLAALLLRGPGGLRRLLLALEQEHHSTVSANQFKHHNLRHCTPTVQKMACNTGVPTITTETEGSDGCLLGGVLCGLLGLARLLRGVVSGLRSLLLALDNGKTAVLLAEWGVHRFAGPALPTLHIVHAEWTRVLGHCYAHLLNSLLGGLLGLARLVL
jgi:hypothetical protein